MIKQLSTQQSHQLSYLCSEPINQPFNNQPKHKKPTSNYTPKQHNDIMNRNTQKPIEPAEKPISVDHNEMIQISRIS